MFDLAACRRQGGGHDRSGQVAPKSRSNRDPRHPLHSLASGAGLATVATDDGAGAAGLEAMLDYSNLDPFFFTPFVSSVMQVEQGWIDYNGHLNMAYYNVLFDRAVDEAYELVGCGAAYVAQSRHSCFTAEVHVRYLRELHAGDPVRVTLQLLDFDEKRLHYFEQLFHAGEGWLSATSENMALHVDMGAQKTAPFPAAVIARLKRMKAAHALLPVPEAAGRRIAMPRKP
jgi:acyl-CoA thioester hydrolase